MPSKLTQQLIHSSSLLVLAKITQRCLGLASIIILARILTPDDFAIVALTAIIIYFFDMLSNVGTEQYIIQKKNISADDLNTAWTIDLLSKGTLWLILFIAASPLSAYFEQPQLANAIYVMATIIPVNALKNPGLFLLKSNLEYKRIFWLSVFQKLLSFILVIWLASVYQSFWALIIADVFASIFYTMGSYYIHSFRPKISLQQGKKQWLFSKWLLLKGIVGYIRAQIDTLIVSKLFPSAALGQYYMARNIAMLPAHNIFTPAIEPLLAAFKQYRHSNLILGNNIRICFLLTAIFSLPISFFIWYFPQPLIDTLLGEKWQSSYSILSSMALLIVYFPFILIFEQAFLVNKRVKALFVFDALSLITIIIALTASQYSSIETLAIFRGGIGIISAIVMMSYLHYIYKIKILPSILFIIPISLASLAAVYCTFKLTYHTFAWPIANLAYQGTAFVLFYLLFISILLGICCRRTFEVNEITRWFTNTSPSK